MSFNATEFDFIMNQEAFVSIVPNFSSSKLKLIAGDVGPFTPGLPLKVPLYIAVELNSKNKCRILPPSWLNVDTFKMIKETEINSATLSKLPSDFFIPLTKVMFDSTPANIPQIDQIKILYSDITDSRSAKLKTSLSSFLASKSSYAAIPNITQFEICTARPFMTHALNQIDRIKEHTELAAYCAFKASSESQDLMNSSRFPFGNQNSSQSQSSSRRN